MINCELTSNFFLFYCLQIPIQVSWHNDSFLVFAVGDRGQYQIFDIALSPLLLLDGFNSMPSLTKELV